jgi:hypothetical protein
MVWEYRQRHCLWALNECSMVGSLLTKWILRFVMRVT